jgi:hypothetical protein
MGNFQDGTIKTPKPQGVNVKATKSEDAAIEVVKWNVRLSLIRLNDNRAARLQRYPSGYIATGIAC